MISRLLLTGSLLTTLIVASPAAAQGPGAAERNVFGWYLGVQIRPNAILPQAYGNPDGPKRPTKAVPDLDVYVTGPVDPEVPSGPAARIPRPGGGTAVLPKHQLTVSRIVDEARPYDAIGRFVVPGPKATAETVLTRRAPKRSMAGKPLAYAIKMGAGWTELSSHVAIEYGLKAGLLRLKRFDYGGLMWTETVDGEPFDARCDEVKAPPGADSDPTGAKASPDKNVFGWYLGMPMRPNAIIPQAYGNPDGPAGPSDAVPDVTTYITAPVDPRAPVGPARLIPRPDGTRKNLPPHQLTFDRLIPGSQVHDGMGAFVVPGPRATAETVRTQADPENSVPGAPLVEAIKIGTAWTGVNSHVVIDYGVERGLLTVVPFEFGGLQWTVIPERHGFWAACR